ncbi:MAG: hypothetical protein M3O70_08885 [Actinomycetota bacterium]|nr:hypothetical protein [Actinomycetota bacterium]
MARFKVVGPNEVDGVSPGGHVEIDDPARARVLVRGGHLAPAPAKPAKKRTTKSEDR